MQLFGEAVLGLSQGSVSELLSKPKPWHMLSIKGREPFIRMQLWLNDPQNIEKLQILKNERRDNAKRKRLGGGGSGGGSGFDSSSDRSSPADPTDFYGSAADSPGSAKKQRILFTDEQKEALKVAFALDPYPSTSVMEFLSQDLGLEMRSLSNWFHNHRMRLKQQAPHDSSSASSAGVFPSREGQGSFDPVKYKLLCHQRMLEQQQQGLGQQQSLSDENSSGIPAGVSSFFRQFGLPLAAGLGAAGAGEAGRPEGLDLTFKSKGESGEGDKDSIAASSDNQDDSGDEVGKGNGTSPTVTPTAPAAPRSRRKPAAPQWVRPTAEDDKKDNNNLTINGVCVMNSYALSGKKGEEGRPDQEGRENEDEDEEDETINEIRKKAAAAAARDSD